MDVHYWRLDGTRIALPCADIFRRDGVFSELRIFMDVNPLLDLTIAVEPDVSVFTMPDGHSAAPPNTMRRQYMQDQEGIERVVSGWAPMWSMSGPHCR